MTRKTIEEIINETQTLKGLIDEFNDDIIKGDGTCSPVPGSDADFDYDPEDIAECAGSMGLMPAPVDEPNRCEACGTYGKSPARRCPECGL